MNRTWILLAVCALAFFQIDDAVSAQDNPELDFDAFGYHMTFVLGLEEVHEELGLTDEQKQMIGSVAQDFERQVSEQFAQLMLTELYEKHQKGEDPEDATEAEKKAAEEAMEKREKAVQSRFAEKAKELVAGLDDTQKARLQQLAYQRMGAIGAKLFLVESVQQILQLSGLQIDSIKTAQDEMDAANEAALANWNSLHWGGPANRRQADESFAKTTDEANAKLDETLAEVLTEEQIAKVESLKGETFEFPTRRSGGGGRPKR